MKSKWIVGAVALACLPIQAQAKHSDIKRVCVSLDRQARVLTMDVHTRCLRSGTRLAENSLALSVDQTTAAIRLTGQFKATYPYRVGPADCMGSRTFSLQSDGVEQRRYVVAQGGERLGVADFTESSSDRHCFNSSHHARRYLHAGTFAGWSRGGAPGWEGWREGSVLALVAPLLGGPSDSLEEQPETDITMKRARWLPQAVPKPRPFRDQGKEVMIVTITRHGLMDDSVSGQRFTAIASTDGERWRLMQLFSQSMCARGPEAVQWVSDPCP